MTRGQIAVITKDGLMTSVEFNGDMYMSTDKWAGHGEEVIDLLRDVKDVADYHFAVASFNKDNHHYNDEKIVYSFNEQQRLDMLDFTKEYFEKWFSDYVYIKNITENEYELTTEVRDENGKKLYTEKEVLKPNQIAVLCFGRLVLIYK